MLPREGKTSMAKHFTLNSELTDEEKLRWHASDMVRRHLTDDIDYMYEGLEYFEDDDRAKMREFIGEFISKCKEVLL